MYLQIRNWKCYNRGVILGMFEQEENAARKRDLYLLEYYPSSKFKMNFKWKNKDILFWSFYFEM